MRTQRLSLPDQLESGIRALDIRCRHVSDSFNIYHGSVYQRANFDDVLTAVVNFLKKNPGETVLMRVKEEHEPTHNTRTFEETFRLRYWESYKSHMWQGTNILTSGALGYYYKNRVGIIMADFPGPGLIDRTIALNQRFKK